LMSIFPTSTEFEGQQLVVEETSLTLKNLCKVHSTLRS